MTSGERQTFIAKQYATSSQVITPNGSGVQLVLKRDPRRFYIEFRLWTGTTRPRVFPGDIPSNAIAGMTDTDDYKVKFHDCPGLVTGEWSVITNDALVLLWVITDTYIGD